MPHRGRTLSYEDGFTVHTPSVYRLCFTRLTLNAMPPSGDSTYVAHPWNFILQAPCPTGPNLGEFMQKIKGSVGNSEMKAQ